MPRVTSTPAFVAFLMLRRHSWFMAARTSSSLLGPSSSASGTQKLYCGCPAANPPVVGTFFQPSSRSRATTASAASSLASAGTSPSVPSTESAMAALIVAACQRRVTTGGPIRMPNAPWPLRYAASGVSQRSEVGVEPVDVRPLGEVGEVALDLGDLAVEHEADAEELARPVVRVEPADRLATPLVLDLGPGGGLQEADGTLLSDVVEMFRAADGPDREG